MTTYTISGTGIMTQTATSKRAALRLGYEMARTAYMGGVIVVAKADPADCYPIAKWQREPGRRPRRLFVA